MGQREVRGLHFIHRGQERSVARAPPTRQPTRAAAPSAAAQQRVDPRQTGAGKKWAEKGANRVDLRRRSLVRTGAALYLCLHGDRGGGRGYRSTLRTLRHGLACGDGEDGLEDRQGGVQAVRRASPVPDGTSARGCRRGSLLGRHNLCARGGTAAHAFPDGHTGSEPRSGLRSEQAAPRVFRRAGFRAGGARTAPHLWGRGRDGIARARQGGDSVPCWPTSSGQRQDGLDPGATGPGQVRADC